MSAGCSTLFPTGPTETLPSAPVPVVSAASAATFQDGTARVSEVEAWRDREPVAGRPPPCVQLCARVRIVADGFEPSALQVTELWAVRAGAAERFGEVLAGTEQPGLVAVGQRGPDLDPGEPVRIVARLRRSDGTERLVRSPEVAVEVRG